MALIDWLRGQQIIVYFQGNDHNSVPIFLYYYLNRLDHNSCLCSANRPGVTVCIYYMCLLPPHGRAYVIYINITYICPDCLLTKGSESDILPASCV